MSATMLPSKPKSGVSEASNNKSTPATPRGSKLGRVTSTKSDSHLSSPLQSSRIPIDRSPRSVDSKPTVERRSPKISTTPDKPSRILKGSELQAQLGVAQEDLKKAREQLVSVEKEKAQALEKLNDAKKSADEANEKLKEALLAQKKAEESSEIEKFRADEVEQAGIEASQKRDEEWQKELEDVRKQHSTDLSALLSATEELQRVKHELAMSSDAKNTALSHADDAMKIAEINTEKVVILSGEVSRLKALLDSKMENMSKDSAELVKKLDTEVDALRSEVARAKVAKEKLVEMEGVVERLTTEVNDAKKAEADADKLVDEWKRKAELFEAQVEQANLLESKSAEVVTKLEAEVDTLRHQVEGAKTAEEKLVKIEAVVEELKAEVTDARMAEMGASELLDEWKRKAELLQDQVDEANKSADRSQEQVKKLDSDLAALKHELERTEAGKEKLVEMEILVEGLRTAVTDANRAEMDTAKLVDEWKRKAELLEVRVEEANQSEKSLLDTLASVSVQLEESNVQLKDAESDRATLKEMVESLKNEVSGHKTSLQESDQRRNVAQQEASDLGKTIEVLKSEIQKLEEEKLQSVDIGKIAASNIESLSEERNKLLKELEIARDEDEKTKKAMEGLASALHEVSTEARETQERFLIKKAETEEAHAEIEELRSTLENTKESYEVMLDEARYEIVCLKNSIGRFENEVNSARADWDAKEHNFVNAIKFSEEELASLKIEMGKAMDSVKAVEHESQAAKEAEVQMMTKLRQAESGEAVAKEAAEEAKRDSLQLKERLMDKENELQCITQENNELRVREAAAQEKVRQLSAVLAEATAKGPHENGEPTNSENEYDLLTKDAEFHEQKTDGNEVEKTKPAKPAEKLEDPQSEDTKQSEENQNGNVKEVEQPMEEAEAKMWESVKVTEKDLGTEDHEAESTDGELESKADDSTSIDQLSEFPSEKIDNGAVSPTKSLQQKKKKPLLHKFGSLLKKKSNHK